jgi:hypothetical protein
MLIYEKDNKLNINFENNVEETPDLQISKESGKTEVLIDGQSGGGSGGSFVIRVKETAVENGGTKYELDKTWQEISDAIGAGMYCCIVDYRQVGDNNETVPHQVIISNVSIDEGSFVILDSCNQLIGFSTDTKDGYPYILLSEKPLDPGDMDTPGYMEEP